MTRDTEQLVHGLLSAVRAIDDPCILREARDYIEEARDRLSDLLHKVNKAIERDANRELFQ